VPGPRDATASPPEDAPAPGGPPPSPPDQTWWERNGKTFGAVAASTIGLVAALVTILPWMYDKATQKPCPGAGCEGKTPKTGGCAVDVDGYEEPPESNPARLQIRYSTRCDAVWGRILQGEPGDTVTVNVRGGQARQAKINYDTDQFTKMTLVDKKFHVTVCAIPNPVTKDKDKWKRYCIEATDRTAWTRS
jgi:hypothetical protein